MASDSSLGQYYGPGDQFDDFKKGKEKAFDGYFETYSKGLLRYLLKGMGMPKEDAEEVLLDAFFKLWQSRDRIEAPAHIRNFLYHVARNGFIDWCRMRKYKSIPPDMPPLDHLHFLDAHQISSDLLDSLNAFLTSLPQKERAVARYCLYGFNAGEIAQLHGTSVNTVNNQIKTLRKKFLKAFKNGELAILFLFMSPFIYEKQHVIGAFSIGAKKLFNFLREQ